jgi:cytochrome c biogenesis protein CcdA
VVLIIAGVLGQVANVMLPPEWERRFEVFGGLLLVATGVFLLAGLISGRIKVHTHHHHHTGAVHHHFHLHLSGAHTESQTPPHTPAGHQHPHGSTAVGLGALFAMGGARSLLTVAPIALARTVTESVVRISVFCLGIIVSMVIYGWLTQRALMSLEKFADGRHNRKIMLGSGYAVALFCIVAGAGVLLGKF